MNEVEDDDQEDVVEQIVSLEDTDVKLWFPVKQGHLFSQIQTAGFQCLEDQMERKMLETAVAAETAMLNQ